MVQGLKILKDWHVNNVEESMVELIATIPEELKIQLK